MQIEKWKNRLKRLFKLRFAVLYLFGGWAVICGYSTEHSIMRAIWFILLGLGIRAWANCYAIKMEKLTTSGPYAHVRHPLYLGSFLIMTGFLIMLNVSWVICLLFVSVVIGSVYNWTIRREEKMLYNKFGQEYQEYRKAVWAFFPRITPFKGGQKWKPSLERYIRSQEYKLFIWIIILVIAFHLKEEFFREGDGFDAEAIRLIAAIVFLGALDFLGGIFRKKMSSKLKTL